MNDNMTSTKGRTMETTRARRRAAWVAMLALLLASPAWAQIVLESASNATLAGSGPTGNGPSAANQVVTLRHNTNNNTGGDTMATRPSAVTATFSLTNQQFSGLTAAEGYPASTGGNAVFFGGAPQTSGNQPLAHALYTNLGAVGATDRLHFASLPASSEQTISLTANAGVALTVSSNAIQLRAPATANTARVHMADLVITFNVPVTDPILHLGGMGGVTSVSSSEFQRLGIASEFDLITGTGQTLTHRQGNTNFEVSGARINNRATTIAAACSSGGACGSVRVNGTGITSITLRIHLRGDGRSGATWNPQAGAFSADHLLIGVSVAEPPPTVTVRKVSTSGVGTFNFTGTNGYPATAVTTATAGAAVDGTTRTLSLSGVATTLTEAATAGYRLTDISCTGLGAGGTATPTVPAAGVAGGGSVALDAAATAMGSHIVCTFTNEKLPTLRLQKSLPNGRNAEGDQFVLAIVGPDAPGEVGTTGTGTTATGTVTHSNPTVGSVYTLSEYASGTTVLADYSTTYSCTNTRAGGQTPSGSGTSFTVTPASGDDLTCTFTNARVADVSMQTSVTPDPLVSGGQAVFTLVVTNHGPSPAHGAVISNPAAPGLDCIEVGLPPPSCTVSGSAACPSPLTAADLQSGAAIPALPNGGVVTIGLTCNVTASGLP